MIFKIITLIIFIGVLNCGLLIAMPTEIAEFLNDGNSDILKLTNKFNLVFVYFFFLTEKVVIKEQYRIKRDNACDKNTIVTQNGEEKWFNFFDRCDKYCRSQECHMKYFEFDSSNSILCYCRSPY